MWGAIYWRVVQNSPIRMLLNKKNEVFGGDSTHGRAPPAVLATLCRNLPISSTERKPRAKSTKNIWNSEGENELPTLQSNSFELKSRQIIICCTARANVLRRFCRGAAEDGETLFRQPKLSQSFTHGQKKWGLRRWFDSRESTSRSLSDPMSQPSDFLNQPKTTNLKWTLKLRCKDKGFFNTVQVFY